MLRKILVPAVLLLLSALYSCGGGSSSVTAVSLEAEETSLLPGGRTTLTATVEGSLPDTDPYWDKVKFSFRDNQSGAYLDVINHNLDGKLQARAVYVAGSQPGVDVVEVSFSSGAKATVSITVGYGVSSIQMEQYGSDVLATAYDSLGFPVPDAVLDFFITAGTISSSATTNQNGVAQVPFTLPEGVNTARVTASSGTVSATLDVVRTSSRSSRSFAVQKDKSQKICSLNLEQQGSALLAEVRDCSDRPVHRALLVFELEGGSLPEQAMLTDDQGRAVQEFSLDAQAAEPRVMVRGAGVSAELPLE
ncbi:MAG: Ig-like domain-containing protein [Desulfonatronovibrionaceae bacterium]